MKPISKNSMTLLATCIGWLCFTSMSIADEPLGKSIMDFSGSLVDKQWFSVNDNVMGGISKGSFRITEVNTLEFSGTLSLENRGGFASIRTRPANLQLDGYETLAVRFKGDGRTYALNLRTSSRNTAGSYRAPIPTEKNTWQEVRLNLQDFKYTAYGRLIPWTSPLKASEIQSVGFTLADKQPGPFRLEVDWIKAETSTALSSPENKALVESPSKQTARQDARAVIQLAIQSGVPLFNEGKPSACVVIYEEAVQSLLTSHTQVLSDKDRSTLRDALSNMNNTQDPPEQAWILRRVMDEVHTSLK